MQIRNLSTKRSHQIAPYFKYKEQNLSQHKRFDKIRQLEKGMHDKIPNHELANDLYGQLISFSVHAGSKLKRFPPTPYSPTIAKLRNIQCLLKLAVIQHKTSRDMEVNIACTKAKLGNAGYQLPATQELCIQALARATRQLKATIREELETKHLWMQHQNELISRHETSGNTKLAKKLRGMQRAEQVKQVFKRCRAAQTSTKLED